MNPFHPMRVRAVRRRGLRVLFAALGAWWILGFAVPALTQTDSVETDPDSLEITAGVDTRHNGEVLPAPPDPIRPGESLRFSVQYGFIHAGTAWLEVPEVRDWEGHQAWVLVARAKSNGFFDRMYKVRNRIESVWDQHGLFSWRYLEDRHEGKYTANDTILFDPAERSARYKNGQTFDIPAHTQDALSAFYYTRTQALPIGGSISFDYHASRKSAPMEVRVIGRQKIKVPAGRFNCVVVEPILKAGGIFKNKGRLVIWLTDDERRMPVLMKSKVLIGSISVVLQDITPGRG